MGRKRMIQADCPECAFTIFFGSMPQVGRSIECPSCTESLEIISRNPLVLSWATEEDEYPDWSSSYEASELDAYDWSD